MTDCNIKSDSFEKFSDGIDKRNLFIKKFWRRTIAEGFTHKGFYLIFCTLHCLFSNFRDRLSFWNEKSYETILPFVYTSFPQKKNMDGKNKITIKVSRDPKDDKFINCAIDAKAIYILRGIDLLIDHKLKKYKSFAKDSKTNEPGNILNID